MRKDPTEQSRESSSLRKTTMVLYLENRPYLNHTQPTLLILPVQALKHVSGNHFLNSPFSLLLQLTHIIVIFHFL